MREKKRSKTIPLNQEICPRVGEVCPRPICGKKEHKVVHSVVERGKNEGSTCKQALWWTESSLLPYISFYKESGWYPNWIHKWGGVSALMLDATDVSWEGGCIKSTVKETASHYRQTRVPAHLNFK